MSPLDSALAANVEQYLEAPLVLLAMISSHLICYIINHLNSMHVSEAVP